MTFSTKRPGAAATFPGGPDAKSEGPGKRPDPPRKSERKRGRPNLERAHKTIDGSVEPVPGAPRSGSA